MNNDIPGFNSEEAGVHVPDREGVTALLPYEEKRPDILSTYGIAGRALETTLKILCEIAATFCGAPIAAITLPEAENLDLIISHGIEKRAWKSMKEGVRDICSDSLLSQGKVIIVEDTLEDPGFATRSLVTGDPFIRFYAATPMVTGQGEARGCFCVMDTKPGSLNEEQISLLVRLSELTISIMDKEKSTRELARLLHLEKEVYNKLLLSTADLASAAPTFDDALNSLMVHLDPKLGWLSARIRNMQTGGTTGIYYNETLTHDPELPLIWNRIDTTSSHPLGESPVTNFVNSAPLRPEYSHLMVPVRIRDRLVALLELLYPDHRRADPRVREVFNLIAANLAIVAERELINVELKFKAKHDPVSGAATRELFIEKLTVILDETQVSNHRQNFLFCFDINGFQSINDDFGYETGVQLLKEVAKQANRLCEPEDFLGRLVGGEFLLLVHNTAPNNGTQALIKRVENTLNGAYQVGDVEINVTMSIGCVILSSPDVPPHELIRRSEEAMHLVKNGTRSGVCIADAEVLEAFQIRRSMDRKMKEAVKSNRMTLHYQPIIEIESGRIAGAEALLRLIEKDGSITAAGDFIGALERTRILPQVDEWVFCDILHTLKTNSELLGSIPGFYVSLNVSPDVVATEAFRDRFLSQLRNESVDPELIHIEITEKALLQNTKQVTSNLKLMKDNGILVSLDDFGTGYSNLHLLAKFPVDIIKIDKSFLAGIVPGNETLNSLLASITDIAKNFGCAMIGEGVEEKSEADKLLSLGCAYAQGYFYGKPMPIDEFKRYVKLRN